MNRALICIIALAALFTVSYLALGWLDDPVADAVAGPCDQNPNVC